MSPFSLSASTDWNHSKQHQNDTILLLLDFVNSYNFNRKKITFTSVTVSTVSWCLRCYGVNGLWYLRCYGVTVSRCQRYLRCNGVNGVMVSTVLWCHGINGITLSTVLRCQRCYGVNVITSDIW